MSSLQQQQTLALAGMLQACALVESLAKQGSADKRAIDTSIASIFVLNPSNTEDVFADLGGLELGFTIALEHLQGKASNSSPESLRYVLSLLHLERKLSKNPAMLEVISSRLDKCQTQVEHFGIDHENVIASLASLYSDTLSTYAFRIQVRGDFNQLQQPRVANQIRALLLAGIRATILWRQLGGTRFKLFWHRKKHSQYALDYQQRIKEMRMQQP